MSKSIPVHVSIEVQSENGDTIEINSITVNNQDFVLKTEIEQKKGERLTLAALPMTSLAMAPLLAVDQVNSVRDLVQVRIEVAFSPCLQEQILIHMKSLEHLPFFQMFWGSLTYQVLDQSRTQVTFNGEGAEFDPSFVGK